MKKKNQYFMKDAIFWGIALIIIGIGAILCASGIIHGNIYLVIMTLIMGIIALRCLISLIFIPAFAAIGHLIHLYRGYLGIPDSVRGWLLIMAATLVGIGLELIFGSYIRNMKRKRKAKNEQYQNDTVKSATSGQNGPTVIAEDMTGSDIHIENGFGEQTRYVRSQEFSSGHIENGFGSLTVYFEDVKIKDNNASLNIENGFGHINIYLPASWAFNYTEDNGLGQVNINGNPSTDPNAPVLNTHIENGMGKVDIYFA